MQNGTERSCFLEDLCWILMTLCDFGRAYLQHVANASMQNSLQMCRNPLSSHNYSVSKFQVQTPSRIAYPSNYVHITAHTNNLSAKHPFKLQFFITKLFSSEFSPETWQLCDCDCDQNLCTFWMNSDAFLVFRTHPESSCRSILR